MSWTDATSGCLRMRRRPGNLSESGRRGINLIRDSVQAKRTDTYEAAASISGLLTSLADVLMAIIT